MIQRKRTDYIILHCSDTVDGKHNDTDAIRNYHIKTNGWGDIGYHFLIEKVKDKLSYQIGRSVGTVGAHCRDGGRNDDSIGVCLIGGFDCNPPDENQYYWMARLCFRICRIYGIRESNIRPHREFNKQKTCPGKMFDMKHFFKVLLQYKNYLKEKKNDTEKITGIV